MKTKEDQPLFNPNSRSLILSFKRRTFLKLGLGISEIDKRMSWRRRREGLPMGSSISLELEFDLQKKLGFEF